MNYILVSLENQTNPHAGTLEVTNSAGTLQNPNANASEEEDEAKELIVVPTVAKHTVEKVGPRKSSTDSKAEEFLTELQNLKTQENEAYPTGISEDTPEILAFTRGSPEGLEAAETLAKVLTQRTKTYTRKVKTGLRRKLDADEVNTGEGINTGFTNVNTAFEEINSGDESIIPSPKKGQREGKAVLEEKSQSKKTKKHIREEQASLAEIIRLQAQKEAENARKAEQQRQDALIARRVQDELELSETQKNRMAQVQEATKYFTEEDSDSVGAKLEANRDLSSKVLSIDFSSDDFAKKMVELINETKRLYKEQREREETDL
ncbi:hypothetical protein Tco_0975212 [Tanacetum coccineum]|uniref:Uncharacterized protein n=1 Tax=Tanacetum coccineum TaxID=301880 RepID=A0ABQ5EDS8_9ASTR